tara:strand:+ start:114 stop:467 length:354 start_codon:yes stop_codon:yes gene_type:complete
MERTATTTGRNGTLKLNRIKVEIGGVETTHLFVDEAAAQIEKQVHAVLLKGGKRIEDNGREIFYRDELVVNQEAETEGERFNFNEKGQAEHRRMKITVRPGEGAIEKEFLKTVYKAF